MRESSGLTMNGVMLCGMVTARESSQGPDEEWLGVSRCMSLDSVHAQPPRYCLGLRHKKAFQPNWNMREQLSKI